MVSKALPYFRLINENDGEAPAKKEKTHICTLCQDQLSGKNESNLVSHLMQVHYEVYHQLSNDESHPSIQRLKLLQQFVEIVSANGRPFSYLADSGFQKLIKPQLNALETTGHGIQMTHNNFAEVKHHLQETAKKVRAKISSEVKRPPIESDGGYRYKAQTINHGSKRAIFCSW